VASFRRLDVARGEWKMPRKSPNNEGSVYQRESDGLWVAAVTLPSGRRRARYGKTEKEALRKRRALLAEVEAGRPLPAGRTPTLGQYLEHWLRVRIASEVEAGHLRASTADSYEQKIRSYVLGTPLAEVRLDRLTPDDIRAWQRAQLRKTSIRRTKLSPRSVGMAHAAIRRALGDGVRDGALPRNVAALVPLPKGQTAPVEPFDEAQLAAVLAEAISDRLRVLWLTMLGLGLRKGECLGLRWSRIDLEAGTVRIRKQILREREPSTPDGGRRRGHLVEVDTKTPESKATMVLPAALVAVLREHRKEQIRARLAARVWADEDLVFTTRVGTALEPRNVNRSWDAVCKRAGARCRVHDLRHAAASLAFAEGASIKEVQEMLRHSRESTTSNIYVHLLESVRQGTASKMDSVLRRLGSA
jgi:integrase